MTVLFPCPGCGRTRKADEGHHLCRECEGYAPKRPRDIEGPSQSGSDRQAAT